MRHSVPLVETNPSSGRVVTFHLQCPLLITSHCPGPIVTCVLPASCSPVVCGVHVCVWCMCAVCVCGALQI